MKSRMLTLLALMLCMSALFLPVSAYAATDTTAPTINAWAEGEVLCAEASDRDTGVEAVYVNGHRFGYLVDGAVEASPLRDYAGTEEYISVHAVDYAGNKSQVVKIKNPYYTAPTSQPSQTLTTPAPDPAPQPTTPAPSSSSSGSTPQPASTTRPAPASTPTSTPVVSPEPTETESAVPDSSSNAFTPDGTGSVQDNATESDGKEFFTIVTENENTFFLIIDRKRDSEGVYLLNAVTEDDLMALAEKGDGNGTASGESVIPTPTPEPTPTPDPTPTSEPDPVAETPTAETGTGTMIFIIIAVAAVGVAGYYFKILKPKQQAAIDGDGDDDSDEYDDELDDGDEYEFLDDEDYNAEFLDDGDFEEKQDGDA